MDSHFRFFKTITPAKYYKKISTLGQHHSSSKPTKLWQQQRAAEVSNDSMNMATQFSKFLTLSPKKEDEEGRSSVINSLVINKFLICYFLTIYSRIFLQGKNENFSKLQTKVRATGETLELLNLPKVYGKPASPSMPYHGKK